MTRKRSSYRAKPVMTDPLSMLRPATRDRAGAVMLRFLSALDAMSRGDHPGEAEWRDLSDAVNTIETLALHQRKLVAAEVMPTVNAAIAAMVLAARRFEAGQGMRLDAAGLQALRELIDVYGQCCDGLTEREMCAAQQETQRRMHALLRKRTPDLQVVAL